MPRQEYNVSRQRSTSNAITINGLLTWRARRLRSFRLKEGDEGELLTDIAAIDRVLVNVIGFTEDIAALSRDFRREALFRRGELYRMVCDVLREADRPLMTREVTLAVTSKKGVQMRLGRQSREWINRVRKVCQKLGNVEMALGDNGRQVWRMRSED